MLWAFSVRDFKFGSTNGSLNQARNDEDVGISEAQSIAAFKSAQRLSNATLEFVLKRIEDSKFLPFIHVTLVKLAHHPATPNLDAKFPWKSFASMPNTLLSSNHPSTPIKDNTFPVSKNHHSCPLPEDFAVRELLWEEMYLPADFFKQSKINGEGKYCERASMTSRRNGRRFRRGRGLRQVVGENGTDDPSDPVS